MSEGFSKQMKAVALVVLALAALGYVYQYGRSVNQAYPSKSFSVDGEAKLETPTNIANFTVSVVSEGGANVTQIQSDNTAKMNAITGFLKEQGVDKKDLQTKDYSLVPRYQYAGCTGSSVCPPPSIVGYTLNQTLSVKVRNLDTLGAILSGVVEKGANTVSNVSFVVDDDDESDARKSAREEAIAQAKEKANDLAKAGGFRVGKLINIYEDQAPQPLASDNLYGMGGAASEMKAAQVPQVEPGVRSDRIHVTLVYEIRN